MRAILLSVTLSLATCWAVPARAVEDVEALRKRRAELEARRQAVRDHLREFERKLSQLPELSLERSAVENARKALETRRAAAEELEPLRVKVQEADQAVREARDAAAKAHPEYQKLQAELAAADEAMFDAESRRRIAEFVLQEMRRKVARDPGLAATARERLARADETFGRARHAPAAGSEPEAVARARAAREEARKTYEAEIDTKLAADPAAQAQRKTIAELDAAVKQSRAAYEAVRVRAEKTRASVAETAPEVQAARLSARDAAELYQEALQEATQTEREALARAQAALDDAVSIKVDADPAGRKLREEERTLSATLEELRNQIRAAAAGAQ